MESISYMPAAGFGVLATVLIGQALGAKDKELARIYLRQIIMAIWQENPPGLQIIQQRRVLKYRYGTVQ